MKFVLCAAAPVLAATCLTTNTALADEINLVCDFGFGIRTIKISGDVATSQLCTERMGCRDWNEHRVRITETEYAFAESLDDPRIFLRINRSTGRAFGIDAMERRYSGTCERAKERL